MSDKDNRVYIATKVNRMEGAVASLRRELEARGYEIIYDWTEYPIERPFREHLEQAHEAAEKMALAVMRCDILVVLYAEGGLGFHIETGGALVTSIILSYITGQKPKRIYVVGDGNERSVFYFHNSVTRLPDVERLLAELGTYAR